jgi:hypothetical protein
VFKGSPLTPFQRVFDTGNHMRHICFHAIGVVDACKNMAVFMKTLDADDAVGTGVNTMC